MIEITDEIRRAVHEEDCVVLGHMFDFSNVVRLGPDRNGSTMRARDEDALPHLTCTRCSRVWIVLPTATAGRGYDDAERVLYGMLRAEGELARRIVRNHGRREARQQPPASAEDTADTRPADRHQA